MITEGDPSMTKTYIINPPLAIIDGATTGFCFVLATTMVILGSPGSGAVFYIIAAVFAVPFVNSIGVVIVDEEGLTRKLLFRRDLSMRWNEVAEAGLAGESVLNMGKSNRCGRVHFYFSKTVMTDDERFGMMLNWPPKDKIYFTWNKRRMEFVEPLCQKKIIRYNTGDKQL